MPSSTQDLTFWLFAQASLLVGLRIESKLCIYLQGKYYSLHYLSGSCGEILNFPIFIEKDV